MVELELFVQGRHVSCKLVAHNLHFLIVSTSTAVPRVSGSR